MLPNAYGLTSQCSCDGTVQPDRFCGIDEHRALGRADHAAAVLGLPVSDLW